MMIYVQTYCFPFKYGHVFLAGQFIWEVWSEESHKLDLWYESIEFQVRGLPHLHGVFWLTKDEAKKYQDDDGDFLDTKVPDLIDKWISCSLETGDEDLD